MATLTLAELRTQVRNRADMARSQFISDSEFNTSINASIRELYDLLSQKFGEDYFATSTTISTVAGTDTYALPTGFYRLLGVDQRVANGEWVTLKPFMFSERNRFNTTVLRGVYGADFMRYRIQGNSLILRPVPQQITTLQIWYQPQFTSLVLDGDTFDGYNGWEEFVIVDAVMKAKQKEESDVSVEMAQKQALIKRIEEAAGNRDAGMSFRVTDVRRIDFEQGTGFYD